MSDKPPPKHTAHGNYARADHFEAKYNALGADFHRYRDESEARIRNLEAALEPFRHKRVRRDDPDCDITDLIGGTVCVVAYVRNGELADHFNVCFERARAALASAPSAKELCPHGFVLADNTCGPCSEGRPNRVAP